jgi:hypothetical protein
MKCSHRLAIIPAILAILVIVGMVALTGPGASAQANTGAFQCMATASDGGHITIYISSMIPGAPAQKIPLTNAWSAYVRQAYPQANFSTTICNPGSADPAIQQRVIATEQAAWQKSGMQVVQVNWNGSAQGGSRAPNRNTNPYADASPAKDDKGGAPADKSGDADAAPPAPSGPPPRESYCYSDEKKPTIYFSDPFDTQGLPSATAWQKAFVAMLAQKYSYKGIVTCKDKGTFVDAQSAILEQKDGLQGKQLIDTDWSYEPPAAPAADSGGAK